eukprot:CAMPEP_0177415776 /NCGR_PEP_ID=MMETSP0368-20130122/67755_1 /TAXON_ID=447022 ORGANISM="Scrippsiella hangoei-like, Strain SHHI-4" /NCGR_SAMPLE_ID=MMETSP0368 /ASSEMBLY_ACC=CAM_ASM_000363 /LENGTH=68 /DNA_ID=CAMNT_0018885229 /DNA_START=15 /DNA_END=218 /DNA_ORIENTATION=+
MSPTTLSKPRAASPPTTPTESKGMPALKRMDTPTACIAVLTLGIFGLIGRPSQNDSSACRSSSEVAFA